MDMCITDKIVNTGIGTVSINCRIISLRHDTITANVYSLLKTIHNISLQATAFNYDQLHIKSVKHSIMVSDTNCCINFTPTIFIKELMHSYSKNKDTYITTDTKESIMYQILLDFHRMIIRFNSVQITSPDILQNKLDMFQKYCVNPVHNIYWLLLLLCTQASFFYSYFLLHSIYTVEDIDMYILQDSEYPIIDIIHIKPNTITVIMQKNFNYKNILNHNIESVFKTYVVINIDLCTTADGYVFYGKSYGTVCDVKLYWTH